MKQFRSSLKTVLRITVVLIFFTFNAQAQNENSEIRLTEVQKEKIRLEEQYRYEIQQTFISEEGSKVLKFLNSSFGLWLLSSVVIAVFSYFWNNWKSKSDNRKFREERLIKLLAEFGYRISLFQNSIDDIVEFEIDFYKNKFDEYIFSPISDLFTLQPAYPEFNQRGIHSLVIEMNFLFGKDGIKRHGHLMKVLDKLKAQKVKYLNFYSENKDKIDASFLMSQYVTQNIQPQINECYEKMDEIFLTSPFLKNYR